MSFGYGSTYRFAEEDQALVEDAIQFIIFLAYADKLCDIALGMYDFALELMIEQNSQKVSELTLYSVHYA